MDLSLGVEWLNLALRWFHVITAIAWIGSSFYFIWLDLSLETPDPDKQAKGLGGELWSIHGGGFYEVGKYKLFPPSMPGNLHWFKWEAYSTWLSGTLLLFALYYWNASTYLVGGWFDDASQAIAASLAYLAAGFAIYEVMARSRLTQNMLVFSAAIIALLTLSSWLAFELFPGRAAILHFGALLASIMAGNVFFGIIPSQKALVSAFAEGREPDASLAHGAKRRSTHNNYFTLPVVLCMVANHYPFLYGQTWSWLLVVGLSLTAAYARHFFNLKHQGQFKPYILAISAVLFVVLLAANQWLVVASRPVVTTGLSEAEVGRLVTTHCSTCHSNTPTFPGYSAPPGGYVFEDPASLLTQQRQIITALQTSYMPLGNLAGMTDEERAALIAWLEDQGE